MSLLIKLLQRTETWRTVMRMYRQEIEHSHKLQKEIDELTQRFKDSLEVTLQAGHPVYYAGNYFVYRDDRVIYLKTWEKIKHLRKKARIEKAVLLDRDTHAELNCPLRISQTFIKD